MLSLVYFLLWSFSSCIHSQEGQGGSHQNTPAYTCGGSLLTSSGLIESPHFPDPYPPEADCQWVITSRPGSRIHVTSEFFSLEEQTECLWDYVRVSDGRNGQFHQATFCGNQRLDLLSTSHFVSIVFHSDVSGNDAGFRLRYEVISSQSEDQSCNITLTEEGPVTSPNYPLPYPSNSVCFYHIQAPSGHQVNLTFTDFRVETYPCQYDSLDIYDGAGDSSPTLGVFCGSQVPSPVASTSRAMTLKLISDAAIQYRGFNASVRFVTSRNQRTRTTEPTTTNPTTSERTTLTVSSSTTYEGEDNMIDQNNGCNVTIRVPVSNVTSPAYPEAYPHEVTCVTRLRADVLSSFVINFLAFSVEEGENCTYDSLLIYPVADQQASASIGPLPPLRRMCGSVLEDPILTWEGTGLDMVFQTDRTVNDAGYLAHVVITPLVEGEPRCPDVCQNGGTCMEVLLTDGSVDWMCMCVPPYMGIFCESAPLRTCHDLECHHGGLCQERDTGAVCVCQEGFQGETCDTPVNGGQASGDLFFTKMASNMSLSVGSSVLLECAVNDASAHVMWLFHDRILTNADASRGVEIHPGGLVVIPEVRDEHSGRYTCMALTSGDLVERSMWLDLVEPCTLRVTKAPGNLTVREGQAALFQCYVPDAAVTLWRKDGDLITQGPRKRVLVNNYLMIQPVVETDAGQYTCSARGANGCFSKVTGYLTVETTGQGGDCGRSRVSRSQAGSQGRISSGREAPRGSAPWHVVLREQKKDTTFCGGSLISRDRVLTAAHCILQFQTTFGYPFHPRHIHIYLGTHHCVGHNGIYRQLASYVVHENFNDTYYNNDVAILKLDRPVDFSDDVTPICLETPDFVEELKRPGRLGVVTGCGGRHSRGIPPTYLHEVQIPIVAREICRERASAVNTSFTSGMFCAGYSRSMRGDACAGDSGGPFALEFSGRSVLVGVVSWGVGCDRENHYGYYTDVAAYYDWIMQHLNPN